MDCTCTQTGLWLILLRRSWWLPPLQPSMDMPAGLITYPTCKGGQHCLAEESSQSRTSSAIMLFAITHYHYHWTVILIAHSSWQTTTIPVGGEKLIVAEEASRRQLCACVSVCICFDCIAPVATRLKQIGSPPALESQELNPRVPFPIHFLSCFSAFSCFRCPLSIYTIDPFTSSFPPILVNLESLPEAGMWLPVYWLEGHLLKSQQYNFGWGMKTQSVALALTLHLLKWSLVVFTGQKHELLEEEAIVVLFLVTVNQMGDYARIESTIYSYLGPVPVSWMVRLFSGSYINSWMAVNSSSHHRFRARHTLQLSPIATRNTGPATIAGLPAANPQGLQAVCRAIGRISIPARKVQCCSQSQRGISYDPMTHSLSKWEVTDCPARVLLIWNGIARGLVHSCGVVSGCQHTLWQNTYRRHTLWQNTYENSCRPNQKFVVWLVSKQTTEV